MHFLWRCRCEFSIAARTLLTVIYGCGNQPPQYCRSHILRIFWHYFAIVTFIIRSNCVRIRYFNSPKLPANVVVRPRIVRSIKHGPHSGPGAHWEYSGTIFGILNVPRVTFLWKPNKLHGKMLSRHFLKWPHRPQFIMIHSFIHLMPLENHIHLMCITQNAALALIEWKMWNHHNFRSSVVGHHKCGVTSHIYHMRIYHLSQYNLPHCRRHAIGHRKLSAAAFFPVHSGLFRLLFGSWKNINREGGREREREVWRQEAGWCAAQLICIFMFEQCFKLNVAAKM